MLRYAALVIVIAAGIFGHTRQPASQSHAKECTTPNIETGSGTVCGFAVTVSFFRKSAAQTVQVFLGIPYAQTTAGNNRWQAPQPVVSYDDTSMLTATRFGPVCPQPQPPGAALDMSEDCLSLNVWTPASLPAVDDTNRLPVMVFLHGGGFIAGSSSIPVLDGRNIAATGNVVVVSLNYRLGVLGFLSGIHGLKGNYGFLDQQMALQWVRDNIAGFGGDPNNITLFGESSGATAVALHLISPQSQPLFHKAILESNPYGLPLRRPVRPDVYSDLLEIETGCYLRGLDCLRTRPFEHIVASQESGPLPDIFVLAGLSSEILWAPVIDSDVIPIEPSSTKIDKPTIIGNVRNEGLIFAADDQSSLLADKPRLAKADYELILDDIFGIRKARDIMQLPRYRPQDGDNTSFLANAITDYLFMCANRHVATRAKAPVWTYVFTHPPSYNVWPGYSICAPENKTVCHAAELPFVFGNPMTAQIVSQNRSFTSEEKQLSITIMRYWTNFAQNGDPNGTDNPYWQPFDAKKPSRLKIDTRIATEPNFGDNCGFWDEIGYDVPGLLNRLLHNDKTR